MKLFTSALSLFLLATLVHTAVGQNQEENWNLMLVRNDQIKPHMSDDYELALEGMRSFLEEKEVKGFHYFTHLQDDLTFTHITPVKRLKDLSGGIHTYYAKKVKDDEFDLAVAYLAEAVESYYYYVLEYHPDWSYLPANDDWNEGQPYRKWNFVYVMPGMEDQFEGALASWKQLYQDKEISTGYRVFKGFLGVEQPLYLLTTWSKDPLEYHTNLQTTMEALGDDGGILWAKLMEYVRDIEVVEGWYLPQYSYAPGMKIAE